MKKNLDFDELQEAMNALAEQPEKVTEIFLGMPRDKYETVKRRLFRDAFPDEDSVIQFINDLYTKERIKGIPDFSHKVIDFLLTEQNKLALYNAEFWNNGDISLLEIKNRILELIKETAEQNELWPLLRKPETVELKKEFASNFGGLNKIEKNYKHLLNNKLSSGLTLQQHIDKVKDWYNSLHGENLGNWIKLFSFAKAVKNFSDEGNDAIDFREVGTGRYCILIKKDKKFFDFFIKPNKKSGQFAGKTKDKFLKWLYDNQNTVEFPMVIDNELWNAPVRIYEYAEGVSINKIAITINTNILADVFNNFTSINIDEIEEIEGLWETIAAQNDTFTKHRLNSFIDIPLKFLLTLKQIYSDKGDFTTGSGFEGNGQTLTRANLNNHLGNLIERIKKHLQRLHMAGEKSKITGAITKLLLNTTWEIALKRNWLQSEPKIDDNGTWHFNINPAYFARQATAERLKKTAKRIKSA